MSAFKKKAVSRNKGDKNAPAHIIRRDLTDNQAAAIRLKTALEFYTFSSEEIATSLRNLVSDIETLKSMNMSYLAGALYMYENLQRRMVTPADMQTNSEPLLTVLQRIISESGKDSERDIIKYKEVLLTYLLKIDAHLKSKSSGNDDSGEQENY